ncbi:hypothetical protein AMETH_6753 [Amycolatopsis methanolica 239]|uniref:Uncharacterized protein n=1 Tax=Amycolatopsis methanolica 239 TaxID=1068978 RepID=A0A076N7I6_AMYME|nr:hypothetical protein AMETH_6753 [Amycolatopsis methanolica 239]
MQRLRLDLDPLRETLLLTLYARALDSKLPRPILGDADSAALGDTIDYDFAKLELKPNLICGTALRAKKLDDAVREFVAAHPRAVVLDLGCGLDTRVLRCDPPAGVDLTEPGWLDPLPRDRPAMIVAEGLLPFLPGDTFRRLTSELTAHFDTGELAINGYTRFAAWSMKYHPAIKAIGITAAQDFDDPRTPEAWNAGLTLVEEQLLTRAPEVADFPQPLRAAPRLISYSTALSRQGTRILRYRLLTVTLARLRSLPAAVHSGLVDDRGLASDGTIAREGSLDGVPAEFAPVVEALRVHVAGTFSRLHSAYLYGSIPRGTAVPGVSDLDALLAFHDEPTDADRADAGGSRPHSTVRSPRSTAPASSSPASARSSATPNATTAASSSPACARLSWATTSPSACPVTAQRPCSRGRPTAISQRCSRAGASARPRRRRTTNAGP